MYKIFEIAEEKCRERGKLEVAKNMVKSGVALELNAHVTKISLGELQSQPPAQLVVCSPL